MVVKWALERECWHIYIRTCIIQYWSSQGVFNEYSIGRQAQIQEDLHYCNVKTWNWRCLNLATNATGSWKVPLSIIGNSKNPRCFGRIQEKRKLTYFNQTKAWSNTRTFTRWFHEVFLAHIRSTTNDKVLLIMDNCGPHSAKISDPFGQVKMLPLPPNCTSAYQPMDLGIIQAIKYEVPL